MLPGVRVWDLKTIPDERGVFCELLREDWKGLLDEDRIMQVNLSTSHPGIIRAWHRHVRGQVDYFLVLSGNMRICAYDDRPESQTRGQLADFICDGARAQIVRVPGHYWHGTMAIGREDTMLLYFVTRLYDQADPDEERRPWNDPEVLDPRTRSPFEWRKIP